MYRMEGWTSVTWSQNSSHPLCIRIWEHRCHCPACQLDCTPRTSTWSKLRMLSMLLLLLQKIIQISHTAQYAKLLLKCRGSNAFVICNVSSYDKWKIMPSNYILTWFKTINTPCKMASFYPHLIQCGSTSLKSALQNGWLLELMMEYTRVRLPLGKNSFFYVQHVKSSTKFGPSQM